MAAQHNLTVEQGATFLQNITWRTGSPAVEVNLTGYSARCHFRTSASASTVAISLTTENDRIRIENPASGTFVLSLSAADTSSLAAGRYVYDLEVVNDGRVTRLLEGTVKVSPEVTR